MGLHSEASIHKKITDLARQLNLYLNHFPAHEKHALCRQIRESLYSMYGCMIEAQKPVFGICRGFQEINVALGGTLRRDTSASDDLIGQDVSMRDEAFRPRIGLT